MERELRVGIVGAGWAAEAHSATLAQLEDVDVVAVTDLDSERAGALADATGATAFATSATLVESAGLDAIVVATPPGNRRETVVAALEAGIAVYLEKPLARSLDDAQAMVVAAERSRAVCAVGYQWRSVAALPAVARLLEGQELRLLLSEGVGVTQARPWFLDPAQSGRLIAERASHHIDLQRQVGGEVVEVQALGSSVERSALAEAAGLPTDAALETTVSLGLRFTSGALGAIHVVWTRANVGGRHRLSVVGSQSSVDLELDPVFEARRRPGGELVGPPQDHDPFAAALRRFVEAVQRSDPDRVDCTARDAAGTLAVALACERALETGDTATVDPLPDRGDRP